MPFTFYAKESHLRKRNDRGKDNKTEGSVVKRLRHRPFTAVTRVRFPSESCKMYILHNSCYADVAQLAEQLICNQQVIGSSPIIGFHGPLAQLVRATGS